MVYREAVAGTPRRWFASSRSGDSAIVFPRRLNGSRRPVGVDVVLPLPCPFARGGDSDSAPLPSRANIGDSGPNSESSSRSSMRAPRPVDLVLVERVSTTGAVSVRTGPGVFTPNDAFVGVCECPDFARGA